MIYNPSSVRIYMQTNRSVSIKFGHVSLKHLLGTDDRCFDLYSPVSETERGIICDVQGYKV